MSTQQKILVTPRSLTRAPHAAVELLRRAGYEVVVARPGEQPTEEELSQLLPECVGYLAGVEPISARVLSSARNLVAISRNGVGVDNIDAEAASQAGIEILTTPGANAEGVAELTVGLIFAMVRSLPAADRVVKEGGWQRTLGFEVRGQLLGVVGCGNIGRRVAEMALGVGMKVTGYDPYPAKEFHPAGFSWADLNRLFSSADIVTLHSPGTARPLIDPAALTLMKEGAWLVNTARAALVDQAAVLSALDSGRLSGYAVDAHEVEPPADLTLVGHPKVVATPHIGGYTQESVNAAAVGAAQNLIDHLKENTGG